MAREITISCSLSVNNGLYSESFGSGSPQFDQATQLATSGVIEVGTAVETIQLGEVTTAGYAAFRNLSTATAGTAYIALGRYEGTTLSEFVALRRGNPAVLPLSTGAVIGARAYGAPIKLRYIILAE